MVRERQVARPLDTAPLARPARPLGDGPRVLLITEGTYPFVVGGVSTWCDLLVTNLEEVAWQVLPIVPGGGLGAPRFTLPANVRLLESIELWSERSLRKRRRQPEGDEGSALPATLARALLGWRGDLDALESALVWCRRHAGAIRGVFRSPVAWRDFLAAVDELLTTEEEGAAAIGSLTTFETAQLYQTIYWIARTAAAPTPDTDLIHVTAAGWAGIPAMVHKALHGTPVLLTEHGVYVREAYLAAVRNGAPTGERWCATRLARGLTRAAYSIADMVSPVTEVNAHWERRLGVDPERIRVVPNGIEVADRDVETPAPRTRSVVSVGRIDPLKDVHTQLHVAAAVLERVPDATFRYFGPVTDGQEAYGRSCLALHEKLGLGGRFEFPGSTKDPKGKVRESDLVLMTSISEGMPMSILEAMAEARPVVATAVGGVPDVVRGCGLVAAPCDVSAITQAVVSLLTHPEFSETLGRRGHARVRRRFTQDACLGSYRELIHGLVPAEAKAA